MAEKTLKTRILLRNDSAANWEANKTTVLKKGEIGIEIDTNKMKIGDGVTAYGNLKYFGGEAALNFEVFPKGETTDIEAINAAVGDTEIHNGDTAIVKRDIAGNKSSYTAYVYDGEWKAMDGNYRADNVYFDEDLVYTANIGVKTVPSSGSGTITAAGKNVEEVLKSILSEEKNPSNTKPAVSFSTQNGFGTFEIGTKRNLTYTAALSAGSYTYGPATGITAQTWEVSCTGVEGSKDTATGTFENVIAESTAKKITAKANYNEGAIPKTNLGNPYPNAKIAAGSASKDSDSLIGVRHMFYGVLKSDAVLDSNVIRGLKHEAATKKTITTFGAGGGAVKVIIACPAGYNVTKVLMPSAMNADATANFVKQAGTVNVEGAEGYTAVPYTIWMYKPASIDASETYAVTIG